MKTNTFFNPFLFVAFDGDQPGDEPTGDEPTGEELDEKKFSQRDFNAAMAKEKRKTKEAEARLLTQLEETRGQLTAGSEERQQLEKQIEELQQKTMSAEELSKRAADKLKSKHEEAVTSLTEERDTWKNKYSYRVISSEILQAAVEHKAINPNLMVDMFSHRTQLVPVVDDSGKPTDKEEARLDFNDVDSDGKPITLNVTIAEAIKRMTELPQYGHLFEGDKRGGLGDTNVNTPGSRKIDPRKLAKENPAAYRELRKKDPKVIFNSLK